MRLTSILAILILLPTTGIVTLYLSMTGNFSIILQELIRMFSSSTATTLIILSSLGGVGLLAAWVLSRQSDEL